MIATIKSTGEVIEVVPSDTYSLEEIPEFDQVSDSGLTLRHFTYYELEFN